MAKTYFMRFGFGDPRTYTGLAATFLHFTQFDGTAVTPPAIAENYNVTGGVTTGTGMYKFTFGTTLPISFLADAATTSPGPQGRYVAGYIDPVDRADEYGTTLVAIGTTSVALGTTSVALGTTAVALGTSILAQGQSLSVSVIGIGSTASSFGTSATDPVDLFGYMKRIQENLEGNQTFYKASGALTIFSRGSSYTLASKTIANSTSLVVKS
jgi:hypothetical protein